MTLPAESSITPLAYDTPVAGPRPMLARVLLWVWGGLLVLIAAISGFNLLYVVPWKLRATTMPAGMSDMLVIVTITGILIPLAWGVLYIVAGWRIGRRSFAWAIAGFAMMAAQSLFVIVSAVGMAFVAVVVPKMGGGSPPSWAFWFVAGTYGGIALLSSLTCWPLWRSMRMLRHRG